MTVDETVNINVELLGGLEILFDNVRTHEVTLPKKANIDYLVNYMCDKLMIDKRRELFQMDGTVRPGILVLINEADWQLEGEGEYELQSDDKILFVSTLHGG